MSNASITGTITSKNTITSGVHYVEKLKGKDGFSPVITTSKQDDTTTVSITDAEGTKTATILDGDTPVKGTDYFTAADKAEMVAAVLAQVTDATEVTY